jgi:hypothetical protein
MMSLWQSFHKCTVWNLWAIKDTLKLRFLLGQRRNKRKIDPERLTENVAAIGDSRRLSLQYMFVTEFPLPTCKNPEHLLASSLWKTNRRNTDECYFEPRTNRHIQHVSLRSRRDSWDKLIVRDRRSISIAPQLTAEGWFHVNLGLEHQTEYTVVMFNSVYIQSWGWFSKCIAVRKQHHCTVPKFTIWIKVCKWPWLWNWLSVR